MKRTKRILAITMALVMCLTSVVMLVACTKWDCATKGHKYGKDGKCTVCGALREEENPTYTLNDYVSAAPSTFNPHTWQTNGDQYIMNLTSMGFVDSIYHKDKDGVETFKWEYEMATAIEDITADATAEQKTKYKITQEWGRMYKITLNPNAKWEDGTKITAEDYLYSMERLLSSEMKNSRADLYRTGESSVFNGDSYALQDRAGEQNFVSLGAAGFASVEEAIAAGYDVYVNICQFWNITTTDGLDYALITDETKIRDEAVEEGEEGDWISPKEIYECCVEFQEQTGAPYVTTYCGIVETIPEITFADVGLYKIDDYTIVYVTGSQIDEFNFFVSCGSTWLVNKTLYEAGMTEVGKLKATNYATNMATYSSYGPYKLSSFENSAFSLSRNENWYGWTDGKHEGQFQTTAIRVSVLADENTVKQMFLKGELDGWELTANDIADYGYSDYLQQVEDSYTMKFFFNGDLDTLTAIENSRNDGNNVRILSNQKFRKAMSLAFDRRTWCAEVTAGDKPAVGITSNVHYYDPQQGLTYRGSVIVKEQMLSYYGLSYGAGERYATLDEAYNAITGYDLAKAKELFTEAYNEALADGIITATQNVVLHVGAAKGPSTGELSAQEKKFNDFLKAATVDTPLENRLSVKYEYNIENRYADVRNGVREIGFGGLGGGTFYAFRSLNSFVNDELAVGGLVSEGGFDFNTLTLEVTLPNGTKVTKTYANWAVALNEGGEYYGADSETKLTICAQLETALLDECYFFPVSYTCSVSLYSQKIHYITENYSQFYSFGGMRFMTYNYSDAQWADYVRSQGGTLNYK